MVAQLFSTHAFQIAIQLGQFLLLAEQPLLNGSQFTLQLLNLSIITLELLITLHLVLFPVVGQGVLHSAVL